MSDKRALAVGALISALEKSRLPNEEWALIPSEFTILFTVKHYTGVSRTYVAHKIDIRHAMLSKHESISSSVDIAYTSVRESAEKEKY